MKFTKILPVCLALLTMLGSFAACTGETDNTTIDAYVESYGKHEISNFITNTGTVEMGNTMPYVVSTDISSYSIKKMYVAVGDHVKAGDKICEFDTTYIEEQIKELEDQESVYQNIDSKSLNDLNEQLKTKKQAQNVKLKQINDKIASAQQKLSNAEDKYNTASNNYNAALDNYNDAEANLKSAEESDRIEYYSGLCATYQAQVTSYSNEMTQWNTVITTAQDEVKNYQYEYDLTKLETDKEISDVQFQIDTYKSEKSTKEKLDELKKTLENSIVYSKYSGVVSQIMVNEGQVSTDSNIVSLVDDANKIVHVTLNDNDLLNVEEGMKVKITTSSENLGEIIGEIYKINRIKGDNGFDVYIKSDDLDKLSIGMGVTNNIVIFDEEDFAVSKDAVREREDGSKYILVAVADPASGAYVLEERDVTTGLESSSFVQIVEGKIEEGEKIVTMKNSLLQKGVHINPVEKSNTQ